MSWSRALLLLSLLSLGAASVVAVASQTPASVRNDVPPPGATDPSLGATFSQDQIARHGAYRAPSYLAFLLGTTLPLIALLVLARGPFGRLTDALGGGWAVRAVIAAVALAGILALVTLPLAFVRGHSMQQAWGLSTQPAGGWLLDQLKGGAIGAVMAAVAVVAFYGLVRLAPSAWWLWGWGLFTGLTVVLAFIYPVVIAPVFNDFQPLDDPALVERIRVLADEADVDVDEVLVADASRRTTTENAYVAGIGATKQVVVYDTLLQSGTDDETAFVVAHELGHRVENHIWKGVALASFGLLLGFGALKLLEGSSLWAWAGASDVGDVKALPLLVAMFSLASLLVLPVENAVSRAFERRADEIALELTRDPDTAVATFRRLAFKNIADLDPPRPFVWLLFTHPPIPERLTYLSAVREGHATP